MELTTRLPDGPAPAEGALAHLVRHRLGADASDVTVVRHRPLGNLGGLSLLVPILYWQAIPHALLKWAVALVCTLVVGHILWREDDLRAPNAGYWLFACVAFGIGFPAYLWSEPRPLAAWRPPRPLTGPRLTAAVLTWVGLAAAFRLAWT